MIDSKCCKSCIVNVCAIVLMHFAVMPVAGQSIVDSSMTFISPVDHTIRLAGSFGELRSNHFHAGIDIKSNTGEEGDTIRASAPGFVSRIKIQRGGYGQVLYVDHPNGYTSVYAHLQAFSPKLQGLITDSQLRNKSYEIDLYPEAGAYTFAQGDPIGLMGNTGMSYGPHLHFEIRKTDTEIPENPYLHQIGPTDRKAPLLYVVEAHGLNDKQGEIWSKSIASSAAVNPLFEIPAWRAGMAIQTFDLMDGASNKNGIYSIAMYVDDSLYYKHVMDRVGFDVTKYINTHIDYGEKQDKNRTLTKCYVAPGNRLDFYPTLKDRGEIGLYADRDRQVRFSIRDYLGNETTYACRLRRRDAKEGEIVQPIFQKYMPVGVAADVKLGSVRFYFPVHTFDKDTYIQYAEERTAHKLAFKINDNTVPVFSYPVVSVPVLGLIDSSLYHKTVLLYEGKDNYGGHVENDSLRVRIGNFGGYEVVVDTIPPTIEVGSFLANATGKPYFRFAIYDNYESAGYADELKYDVYIDGAWTVASLKALGNILIVPLEKLSPGDHTLRIKLEDSVGNVSVWERDFRT